MPDPSTEFCRVQVDPLDCIRRGWELVKPQYWLLLGICFIGLLIGGVGPMGILLGPMMCGIYLCYLKVLRGESIEFGMLFKGFDHFVQSLVATLILIAVTLVIMIPGYILLFASIFGAAVAGSADGAPAGIAVFLVAMILFLVLAVVGILASLLFLFTYPLIVDRGLSGADAVKASARAVWANLGGIFGLTLLCGLMGMAGMCLCCVGTYFVLPVQFGALTVAYRKVFPEQGGTAGGV